MNASHQVAPHSRGGFRAWHAVLGLVVIAVLFTLAVQLDLLGLATRAEVQRVLAQRGRVATFERDVRLHPTGTELIAVASVPGLAAALDGREGEAVAQALTKGSMHALLIDPRAAHKPGSVAERIARFEHVEGLRGVYVSRHAALYAADPIDALGALEREALAGVARGILGGARVPRLASFPEALRRVQSVEVMVLLLEGDKPRLWRSARGSSLARALLTAATVARQRWLEREQAMGGALDAMLPSMRVEVALLGDDGTVGERDDAFLDRAFGPEHGVGYDDKGSWRYLLPDATRDKGKGRASVAYRALMADDGLSEASFEREDLRLYRLFVSTLATSEPAPVKDDGLAPVRTPSDVLAPPR
jgi:hypothetical protein